MLGVSSATSRQAQLASVEDERVTSHSRSLPLDREFFRYFSDLFSDFSAFSDVFESFRTCSDAFGCVRIRSDAIGCIWVRSDAFRRFGDFLRFLLALG